MYVCVYSLWMATVRLVATSHADDNTEMEVSVATAELWEYLYSNEAGLVHITSPVSVQPVSGPDTFCLVSLILSSW